MGLMQQRSGLVQWSSSQVYNETANNDTLRATIRADAIVPLVAVFPENLVVIGTLYLPQKVRVRVQFIRIAFGHMGLIGLYHTGEPPDVAAARR